MDSGRLGRAIARISEILDAKRQEEDWGAVEALSGLLSIIEALRSGSQAMETAIAELPNGVSGAVQHIMSTTFPGGLDGSAPEGESEVDKRRRKINEMLDSGEDNSSTIAATLSDEGIPTSVNQVAGVKAARTRKKA